jgi:FtsP/CotA-like multicopper oxidase with cupredoxin domain
LCVQEGEGDECSCTNADGDPCEHMFDFNVTNLHAHGAHARPDYSRGGEPCEPFTVDDITYECRECGGDVCDDDPADDACYHADNVLNSIFPRTGAQYRWDIDEDGTHHTGLQWYHPHIHGTTAIQVASGAAGAWIVRGPLDALEGIADARERVMIFSTPPIANDNGFVPLADGEECTDETLTFNDFAVLGSFLAPQLNVINGVRQPRMVTAPGQVERWRILHAGFLDEVFLGLFRGSDSDCSSWSTADEDTIELTQIGRDGLILPQPFEHEYVFMSPGYRVEAMLGGEGELVDGDSWCLVAARFLQGANPQDFGSFGGQPMSPEAPPTAADILARFETNGDLVAVLNVTESAGPATETRLPDYAEVGALAKDMDLGGVDIEQRCAEAAAVEDPEDIDQVAILQVGFWTVDDPDPCGCEAYNVNCRNFEQTDRTLYPFDRDMPLDTIEHWRVAASVDGHPFHIHINPYIVCPNESVFDPIPFPHWRDTYLVNLDRKIDVITENRSYTGPFVFHCHKLTHEDHGMMELIRICDPASDPTCGDYDWRVCDDGDLSCLQALAATDCALTASSDLDAAACVALLGGPGGTCGPTACAVDAECLPTDACNGDNQCEPAPCPGPCPPGQSCQHGACE